MPMNQTPILTLEGIEGKLFRPMALTVIFALSAAAGAFTFIGATYGVSMVFDYGFNVETAGDHPVWQKSEVDVFPGRH